MFVMCLTCVVVFVTFVIACSPFGGLVYWKHMIMERNYRAQNHALGAVPPAGGMASCALVQGASAGVP